MTRQIKKPKTTIEGIKQVGMLFVSLVHDPVAKAEERDRKRVETRAEYVSKMAYYKELSNTYTERVMAIDPHRDWNGFAKVKQAQVDAQESYVFYEQKLDQLDGGSSLAAAFAAGVP